jgi:hypothetical protein
MAESERRSYGIAFGRSPVCANDRSLHWRRARLGQHSRHFWSSEGSTVYKHQKLTLQRALCSCGPTSVAGLKPLRVSRYCQNARNQP